MLPNLEVTALEEELAERSREFKRIRSLIPKLKHTESGKALVVFIEAISDKYLAELLSSDANDVAKISFSQGAYLVTNKILQEIESTVEELERENE